MERLARLNLAHLLWALYLVWAFYNIGAWFAVTWFMNWSIR